MTLWNCSHWKQWGRPRMGLQPILNQLHCYRPKHSWGKVMFSQSCIKNSVHRGEGRAWWGAVSQHALDRVCGSPWQTLDREGVADLPDSHCSGRYTSYWNAFLFSMRILSLVSMLGFSVFTLMLKLRVYFHAKSPCPSKLNIYCANGDGHFDTK